MICQERRISKSYYYLQISTEVFIRGVDQSKVDKSTEIWLDSIEDRLTYRKWYCGHYHTEKKIDRLQIMFNDYAALEP